jgi:hypothetical protein
MEFIEMRKTKKSLKAVFEVGDFSGCFGSSCGDPANVKRAHVTFRDGKLSTKYLKVSAE